MKGVLPCKFVYAAYEKIIFPIPGKWLAAGGETLFETKGKLEFNDKTDSKTGKTDLFFQAG